MASGFERITLVVTEGVEINNWLVTNGSASIPTVPRSLTVADVNLADGQLTFVVPGYNPGTTQVGLVWHGE